MFQWGPIKLSFHRIDQDITFSSTVYHITDLIRSLPFTVARVLHSSDICKVSRWHLRHRSHRRETYSGSIPSTQLPHYLIDLIKYKWTARTVKALTTSCHVCMKEVPKAFFRIFDMGKWLEVVWSHCPKVKVRLISKQPAGCHMTTSVKINILMVCFCNIGFLMIILLASFSTHFSNLTISLPNHILLLFFSSFTTLSLL